MGLWNLLSAARVMVALPSPNPTSCMPVVFRIGGAPAASVKASLNFLFRLVVGARPSPMLNLVSIRSPGAAED